MYNKVILAGNLTRDIEIKNTTTGLIIVNTGIATNRKFKSQTGEQKEEVLFLDITFFGRTAEIVQKYLRKGTNILVEGRLKLDQWTDTSGQKRSKHSLIVESMKMLGGREEGKDFQTDNYGDLKSTKVKKEIQKPNVELTFNEEDLPF